jgi:ABC transporter substrate binding protein (PQQ-dependent alcohol dehydrogenase system)
MGVAAATAGLIRVSSAQQPGQLGIRVGTVLPSRTGVESTVATSRTDYAGEGGRMGALLAEATIGEEADAIGYRVDILPASAPVLEAAIRAAERLVATGNICALIGGVGDGQAEALSAIAETARIPFFNIGSARDSLRQGDCSRFTFHIEPSAAMYLDAMVMWGASQNNYRRWFVVHLDTADGPALRQRAARAIAKFGGGGEIVGSAAVQVDQPMYLGELQDARRANADVIMLLLNATDSIVYTGQQQDFGVEIPVLMLPDEISQTRDYIAASRFLSPDHNPRFRLAAWETTFKDDGAEAFNLRYESRWSEPTDPTGWASYHAVKILFDAVAATGTIDGTALVEYFESPGAVFDVLKGPGVSFRPWDHQLRQPIHVVRVDEEAPWERTVLSTRIGIASFAAELPPPAPGVDQVERLDLLGDGAAESSCRF